MISKTGMMCASLLLLAGVARASTVLDTKWTKAAAADYTANAMTRQLRLPEFRVYDSHRRLIFHSFGMTPGTAAATVSNAIRQDKPVDGPSFGATLAVLETRDGVPAAKSVQANAKVVVVDYWADWCAPCKVLGAELERWAAQQPNGAVQLVRAETDPLAAARASGQVIHRFKKGPDGKLVEVKE